MTARVQTIALRAQHYRAVPPTHDLRARELSSLPNHRNNPRYALRSYKTTAPCMRTALRPRPSSPVPPASSAITDPLRSRLGAFTRSHQDRYLDPLRRTVNAASRVRTRGINHHSKSGRKDDPIRPRPCHAPGPLSTPRAPRYCSPYLVSRVWTALSPALDPRLWLPRLFPLFRRLALSSRSLPPSLRNSRHCVSTVDPFVCSSCKSLFVHSPSLFVERARPRLRSHSLRIHSPCLALSNIFNISEDSLPTLSRL